MSYVLYMTSPNSVDPVLFERTLRTAASASAIDELCREHGGKVRPGIYSLVVVIWLMRFFKFKVDQGYFQREYNAWKLRRAKKRFQVYLRKHGSDRDTRVN